MTSRGPNMKKLLTTALILTSGSAFGAGTEASIRSLKVLFANKDAAIVRLNVSGTISNLRTCDADTAQIKVGLVTNGADSNSYIATVIVPDSSVSSAVCLNDTPKETDFKADLEIPTDRLDQTYILTSDLAFTALSLQDMLREAECRTPTIPVLEGGMFGHGPVMQEVCVYIAGQGLMGTRPLIPLLPGPVTPDTLPKADEILTFGPGPVILDSDLNPVNID